MPSGKIWQYIRRYLLKHRKAWRGEIPTLQEMQKILSENKDITILAVSRRGVSLMNAIAVTALYGMQTPILTIPADVESNPENYEASGKLLPPEKLVPLQTEIYIGMKLIMTRNVRKDIDYINGMECVVLGVNKKTSSVLVQTKSGFTVNVTLRQDMDDLWPPYFPVRPGYASTVIKFQGAEVRKLLLFLDRPNVPAAAYTALSRVRKLEDVWLGGALTRQHFCPASG